MAGSGNKIAYIFMLPIMRKNRCSDNRKYIDIDSLFVSILRKKENTASLSKCKYRP